jgi:hypothetical protein
MKKGRRYIEPMTGSGDETVKKRDVKKIKKESGKTFDGVSRPSNDEYREEYNRIFGEWKSSEEKE